MTVCIWAKYRRQEEHAVRCRYRTEEGVDGLGSEEGPFLLCTFWLAQAPAMSDQVARARAVFEHAIAFVNDEACWQRRWIRSATFQGAREAGHGNGSPHEGVDLGEPTSGRRPP